MWEVIFGAAIALVTTVIVQWWQNCLQQKIREQLILFELNGLVQELTPLVRDFNNNPEKLNLELKKHIIPLTEKITYFAIQLTSKSNRQLAVLLSELCLDYKYRDDEFLYTTLRKLQLTANSKMIKRYEKKVEEDWNKYSKPEIS
jgi:hypothetical protein